MKIGIVTNLYPPYVRGGAEHVVVRTVESLMERGHDVFVITAKPKGKGSHVEKSSLAMERIYRFFPWNRYFVLDDYKHRWPTRLLWHIVDAIGWSGARHVGRILDEEQPDVVITHNLKGIGLRIPGAIHRRKIPHVHVVHDLQLIYPSGLLFAGKEKQSLMVKPFYAAYRAVCRFLFRGIDAVIFPSEYLKEMYTKQKFFSDSNVRVMPNPAPNFEAVAKEGRNQGPLKLLFIGQLEQHKGILFLLDALKQLPVEARLIVAGEGTLSGIVKFRAEQDPRVTYLGYAALDQLINCFSVSDALVVPSLCYENSPTVIYESLQAGTPVLASNIGGVGELVEHGRNGFLFSPNDTEDFYRAIQQLDEQKEAFANRQQDIKATVTPYAIESYANKLTTLLEMLKGKS